MAILVSKMSAEMEPAAGQSGRGKVLIDEVGRQFNTFL